MVRLGLHLPIRTVLTFPEKSGGSFDIAAEEKGAGFCFASCCCVVLCRFGDIGVFWII